MKSMIVHNMLTPCDCAPAAIDYQSAMLSGVHSHNRSTIVKYIQILPEADRRVYAKAYAEPGECVSDSSTCKAFSRDASDFEQFSKTKLSMPVLVLTGEKASGDFLVEQARLVASDVR
jgi:hypothetical protein